ncbi:MAG: hypothetical protein LBS81_01045 [Endomicrobium sp.]|jgi:hypothetical protein|nr:hypothetical protein [Endomicrobium sp.]
MVNSSKQSALTDSAVGEWKYDAKGNVEEYIQYVYTIGEPLIKLYDDGQPVYDEHTHLPVYMTDKDGNIVFREGMEGLTKTIKI